MTAQRLARSLATCGLSWLVVTASASLPGCSREAAAGRASAYRYTWQDTASEAWVGYEITSTEGCLQVEAWMRAHAEELERSDRLGRDLAWIPSHVVIEMFGNGRMVRHALLRSYPLDPEKPKSDRQYVPNFSDEAVADLRTCFLRYGTPAGVGPD